MMGNLKRKLAENLRQPNGWFGMLVGSFMNYFNNGIICLSIDSIPSDKSEVIVEVGIGSGKGLQLCHKRFPNSILYGIDISETMLSSSEKRNRDAIDKGKIKLLLNSIEDIEIADNSVDTLYTINTLYFWDNPNKACIEVRRVLSFNGCFILSFNPKDEMNNDLYAGDIFTFYSIEDVVNMLERNGFEIVSTELLDDRKEKYACVIARKK